ncbi:hypothetical protein ACFQYP_64790 [Nonomuraea antimicrobica]
MRVRRPQLADNVIYRGRDGLQAPRAAIVTATADSLDVRGVEAGEVPALTSPAHVHLHVLTPSPAGFFVEFDVPPGQGPGQWHHPSR